MITFVAEFTAECEGKSASFDEITTELFVSRHGNSQADERAVIPAKYLLYSVELCLCWRKRV